MHKHILLTMFLAIFGLTLGCGGGVEPGVADGESGDMEITEDAEADEAAAARSAAN